MHRIFGKYPVSGIIRHFFYYPIGQLDIISIQEYIWLKFDIIKLYFFSYPNVLKISMHIHDAIISYILLKNYFFL